MHASPEKLFSELRAPRHMLVLARCLLVTWDKAGEALPDDLRRRGIDTVELLKPVHMSAELGYPAPPSSSHPGA